MLWSQRNNNNYSQSGVLSALDYFAANGKTFLRNHWLKAKRAISKPQDTGPADQLHMGRHIRRFSCEVWPFKAVGIGGKAIGPDGVGIEQVNLHAPASSGRMAGSAGMEKRNGR